MARTGRKGHEAQARREATAAGVEVWRSTDDIERSHRRWRNTAVALGALAAFWTAGFADPTPDPDFLTGFLLLEAFTVVPLAYALYKTRALGKLRSLVRGGRDRVAGRSVEAQAELAEIDDALVRIGRLVDGLPDPLRRDAGAEAFRVASRTAAEWRILVERLDDLRGLRGPGRRGKASPGGGPLEGKIVAAEDDVAEMRRSMDRLAVSLAELADASDDGQLAAVTAELDASEARMRLLAESLAELRERDPGEPGTTSGPASAHG